MENRNCRFLQGVGTDQNDIKKIRDAINEEREASIELLNYKKDGTAFRNQVLSYFLVSSFFKTFP